MSQAIIWSGGKPYEYVDGSLQEVQTPQTYTMPDGTKYTYGPDGTPQVIPTGQAAAPVYQGSGQGVPQWLVDQNQGQAISGSDNLPLGGNTSWTVGNQVYSGTQWNGEGGAPWGSNAPGYYNYENTPALQLANQTGRISALNGSPYNTLDANGNVTGSGNWSNLYDSHSNNADAAVIAAVGSIFGAGAMGALGGGAAGAAEGAGAGAASGATGAGVTGFGDAGLMYGGANATAAGTLGGGASVAGGSALGAGAAGGVAAGAGGAGAGTGGYGAGVTGFGDAGTMYGGENAASAGSLGGGASVNGGAALGSGGAAMGAPGGGGSGGSGAMGSGGSTAGTTATTGLTGAGGAGGLGSLGNILGGNGSASDYAGLLAAVGGAYAGSQGQTASISSTRAMDPRMDSLFYGALAPAAFGTMGAQMPAAQTAGNQMMSVGSGLLGQTSPTTATNPYLSGVADDMQRRTQMLLGQNNLAIQGNAVGAGGLGGSRQGVAQGVAAGQAADSLQGQVANLYGTAYAGDQNRLIQQQTLGAGLLSQGLQTQFQPLQNTAQLMSPFTGFGTTNNTAQQGGGVQGALGGALGAAQYGHNAGWW